GLGTAAGHRGAGRSRGVLPRPATDEEAGEHMSVALSAEQRELGESLRRFAARHAPMADTRKAFDTLAAGELPGWWSELVANGFHAVHLPERYGGQGGGLLDAACVLE